MDGSDDAEPTRPLDPAIGAGRLNELVRADGGLDRILAVIAATIHDRRSGRTAVTEDSVVATVDRLAAGIDDATVGGVIDHAFGSLGFVGDVARYYDPSNSLVHRVLERRVGIPITLAAVVAELGRRVGVDLRLVGMPGHVLMIDHRGRWFDPFDGGTELDIDGCRRLFARFQPVENFSPALLTPMAPTAFVHRNLNNLRVAYSRLGDLGSMVPLLDLRSRLDRAGPQAELELAELLDGLGRFEQSADVLDRLADRIDPVAPDEAKAFRTRARAARARRN